MLNIIFILILIYIDKLALLKNIMLLVNAFYIFKEKAVAAGEN